MAGWCVQGGRCILPGGRDPSSALAVIARDTRQQENATRNGNGPSFFFVWSLEHRSFVTRFARRASLSSLMASTSQCLASMARLSLVAPIRRPAISTIPNFLLPSVAAPQIRHASGSGGGAGGMRKRPDKKKKVYKTYRSYDLSPMQQFSLCDAMRYGGQPSRRMPQFADEAVI